MYFLSLPFFKHMNELVLSSVQVWVFFAGVGVTGNRSCPSKTTLTRLTMNIVMNIKVYKKEYF